jgi:Mg2+-importing ATPase
MIRLSTFGPNTSSLNQGKYTLLRQIVAFISPLSIVLLVAAAISPAIGDKTDAGIIAAIILIGAAIDFAQSYHARITVERLRATVAVLASVSRDGVWQEITSVQIVPGDLIQLSAGDLVPADAQLTALRDLSIYQAMLTGESTPVDKRVTSKGPSTSADAENMVFLGTSVASGTATAVVITTGPRTAFGDILSKLVAKPPDTTFDMGLRHFSYLITRVVFLLVFVLLYFFHVGQQELRTGWFVEFLATQTFVLLVIRTSRSPFRSRPSIALVATIILIVATGLWLPYSPLANSMEFTPLPASYFAFLCASTLFYLAFVEWAKLRVLEKCRHA